MARFVQIIEYTTSSPDESDRDHPGHYLTIAEFGSYEDAMENSGRDDTSRFASQMAALCDGPPTFRDLDLVEQWEPVAH